MKEKVDRHIDFIIKNTSEEREEKLLAEGATPDEVYQIFRTVQGYNLYQISLLIPIPITRETDGQQWKKSHNEVSKIARFRWH